MGFSRIYRLNPTLDIAAAAAPLLGVRRCSYPAYIARRFKRSLLGYRPSEVEEALSERDAVIQRLGEGVADVESRLEQGSALIEQQAAELVERQARIEELERVADRLAERVVGSERELEVARRDLERLRSESEDRLASFAELARELDAIRRQARGQATRIRLKALSDAADLTERISELAKRPAGMRERLLEGIEEAIARIGEEDGAPPPAAGSPAAGPEPADPGARLGARSHGSAERGSGQRHATDAGPSGRAGNGRADERERSPGARPEAGEAAVDPESNGYARREPSELFEGMVQIEIGPLSDFSQLVGFEDAAGGIGATSQISVRRFTRGRATLDVKLAEPVALLRELEERAPFDFRVRDTRSDRLILDVEDD